MYDKIAKEVNSTFGYTGFAIVTSSQVEGYLRYGTKRFLEVYEQKLIDETLEKYL